MKLEKVRLIDESIAVDTDKEEKISLGEKLADKNIKFSENNKQNAESLGIIAYKKINENEFVDADSVVPVYLRKSQAERMKDAKKNS